MYIYSKHIYYIQLLYFNQKKIKFKLISNLFCFKIFDSRILIKPSVVKIKKAKKTAYWKIAYNKKFKFTIKK